MTQMYYNCNIGLFKKIKTEKTNIRKIAKKTKEKLGKTVKYYY